MDICTIIAKNYVAQARVLARSFREHHPDGRCYALIIDEFEGFLDPAEEPFTVLTPQHVGCEQFQEMAHRYDVIELSTAVKPWLLRHLLAQGAATVTYLDPDIRIFGSLKRLEELAGAHGLVLIPHNTQPIPADGERPNQIDILIAGVYNLGYITMAAGAQTETLLDWWAERLLRDCRVDPVYGYFVDQRWFDLVPGLVSDFAIVREPEYNVAYWNLHSRLLERAERGDYLVDGRPLAFFHFSGFDPGQPHILSRHQTRVRVSANPALVDILDEYTQEAFASGFAETSQWPYTYGTLPVGVRFDRRLRALYEVARERDEVRGSPFAVQGCAEFLAWLGAPEEDAPPGVNRMLANLYGTREDLQSSYPDVGGVDHEAFLTWFRGAGRQEVPVLALLAGDDQQQASAAEVRRASLPAAEDDVVELPPRPNEPWGVNVVGYFRSELGTGEAARQVVRALDEVGVPLLPVHGRTVPPNRQGHAFSHLAHSDGRFAVNLICMNADALPEFATQAGREFFRARHSIGLWFWEVERFPDAYSTAFDHLDELWFPSAHVADAVAPQCPLPTLTVRLPVELPPVAPRRRSDLGLPEGFLFLFSFDYGSVFERKNPLAVVDAYTRAFAPEDGAQLVIKCINAAGDRHNHERLLIAASKRHDVHIVDGYVSAADKNAMTASADCYVSLHRSEGFGLTMAEAMYLGKPVIATAYSGNLDFMTDENSYLVSQSLIPIGPGSAPYPPDARWAQPDLDHAARLMREVFEQREAAAERGRHAAADIRRTHSPAATGEIMARRLETLHEVRGARLAARSARGSSLAAGLARRVADGPASRRRSRLGAPRLLARRALLRLLSPYVGYQQSVDGEIARCLDGIDNRTRALDIDFSRRLATVLAEMREHARRLEQGPVLEAQRLGEVVDRLDHSMTRLEDETHALPYVNGSPFVSGCHPVAGLVQAYRGGDVASAHPYRSFEDTFRGSEEFIREGQRPFLPILDGREPVLEFGCGRGEFLDLLREAGLRYTGVDVDPGMVARCREKRHGDVIEADGLDYLEGLEDASLGAIFSAQVIEHLPAEELLRFLRLARRKLGDGAMLIAETVNPHHPPALKAFWVDPTHQHPIFPEVALALCRDAGFASAYIFHPGGSGDVERDRFNEGAYAVVANTTADLPVESAGLDSAAVGRANGAARHRTAALRPEDAGALRGGNR